VFCLHHSHPQLLRDEIGYAPLHHACELENISLARVLIDNEGGKRALLLANGSDQKPLELCKSNFMKQQVEGTISTIIICVLNCKVVLCA
jgi:hypothetical protein